METFIRIAFWIVTLSGCLLAKSLPLSDSNINFMRSNVICPSDSKFYAPTNVEEQCITTALDCAKRELNGTVKEECNGGCYYIDGAVEYLEIKIEEQLGKGHALINSSKCACERWPQIPFGEFLNKTETLLEFEATLAKTVQK